MEREQAQRLYESKFWEDLTYRQRAEFQLLERRLCMPFSVFQEAVEKCLNRPVMTHEFGLDREGLIAELFYGKEPPTLDEIIELIPAAKRIVIVQKQEVEE